jgi:hypothetical protein
MAKFCVLIGRNDKNILKIRFEPMVFGAKAENLMEFVVRNVENL